MKRIALIIGMGLSLFASARGPARAELADAEHRVDMAIQQKWSDDPLVLIGGTRAFYIEGFGVVMTTELNLVTGPSVNPFHPNLSPEDKERYRKRKNERFPQLKDLMSSTVQQAKTWFPTLKDDEQIALGVQLYRYTWEDPGSIPSQMIWTTTKRANSPVKLQDN